MPSKMEQWEGFLPGICPLVRKPLQNCRKANGPYAGNSSISLNTQHVGPWSKRATLRAYRLDSGGRWSDGSTLRAFLMPRFRAAGAHREELYIPASLADISAYYFGNRARTMRLGFQRAAKSVFLTTDPPPQSNKTAKSPRLTTGPPPQPNKAAKSSRLTAPARTKAQEPQGRPF